MFWLTALILTALSVDLLGLLMVQVAIVLLSRLNSAPTAGGAW